MDLPLILLSTYMVHQLCIHFFYSVILFFQLCCVLRQHLLVSCHQIVLQLFVVFSLVEHHFICFKTGHHMGHNPPLHLTFSQRMFDSPQLFLQILHLALPGSPVSFVLPLLNLILNFLSLQILDFALLIPLLPVDTVIPPPNRQHTTMC